MDMPDSQKLFLSAGDSIWVQLPVPGHLYQDNKYSSFKEMSRVISVIPAGDKDMYYIGVEFLNIKKNKLDIISRYVMKTLWTEVVL